MLRCFLSNTIASGLVTVGDTVMANAAVFPVQYYSKWSNTIASGLVTVGDTVMANAAVFPVQYHSKWFLVYFVYIFMRII